MNILMQYRVPSLDGKNLTQFLTGGFKAGRIMRLFSIDHYDVRVI